MSLCDALWTWHCGTLSSLLGNRLLHGQCRWRPAAPSVAKLPGRLLSTREPHRGTSRACSPRRTDSPLTSHHSAAQPAPLRWSSGQPQVVLLLKLISKGSQSPTKSEFPKAQLSVAHLWVPCQCSSDEDSPTECAFSPHRPLALPSSTHKPPPLGLLLSLPSKCSASCEVQLCGKPSQAWGWGRAPLGSQTPCSPAPWLLSCI